MPSSFNVVLSTPVIECDREKYIENERERERRRVRVIYVSLEIA